MAQQMINDALFVKALERRMSRRLTTEELSSELGIELNFKDGTREIVFIPQVAFPRDLMPDYIEESELQPKWFAIETGIEMIPIEEKETEQQ